MSFETIRRSMRRTMVWRDPMTAVIATSWIAAVSR